MRAGAFAAFALALAPLGACAQDHAAPPRAETKGARAFTDPASVIAAEIAFNRLAQDKGQWTAFRETAAPEAEMFAPRRVNALAWLKGRADPAKAVRWQPHEVWMSCDGAAAVTRGAWQGEGTTGYFTTAWRRQPKDGAWKWVMDQGDALPAPLAAPEMLRATVADCSQGLPARAEEHAPGEQYDLKTQASDDRSLVWTTQVFPDGGRKVIVRLWQAGAWTIVLSLDVAGKAASATGEPPTP